MNAPIHIAELERAALSALEPEYIEALIAQDQGFGVEPSWAKFRKALIRSLIIADLIGRAEAIATLAAHGLDLPIDNDPFDVDEKYEDLPGSIFTQPFAKAIDLFRSKIPSLRAVVDTLTAQAKARAFWITGIESQTALVKIKARMAASLEAKPLVALPVDGEIESVTPTLPHFIDFAQAEAKTLTRARLATVYRTNIATALAEGTNATLTEPEVKDATALWVLHEIHDKRTRGNPGGLYPHAGPHWQMDGFLEAPSNPVWAKIGWPGPAGFQCRRTVSPMTWATATRLGFATEDHHLVQSAIDAKNAKRWEFINSGDYPDKGFGN